MPPKRSKRLQPIVTGQAASSSSAALTRHQRSQTGMDGLDSAVVKSSTGAPASSQDVQEGSEDETEWEEVDVEAGLAPLQTPIEVEIAGPSRPIEVTINRQKRSEEEVRKRAAANAERLYRLEAHKLHTLALLANARIRNRWLNDPLLQARLLSLTPLHLQTAFIAITKRNQPDVIRRGRMFETAIVRLTAWWNSMFEVEDDKGIRSRTWHEVQSTNSELISDRKGKGREAPLLHDDDPIRSTKSLMKHALMMKGSRDISAQLFTALVRALGVPARLVTSLQSVPWQSMKKYASNSSSKASQRAGVAGNYSGSDGIRSPASPAQLGEWSVNGLASESDAASSVAKKNGGARRSLVMRQKSWAPSDSRSVTPEPAGLSDLPVFWTEVFSRPDQRWLPVDPVRDLVNAKRKFEPQSVDRRNRMVYVIAFEEDGHARDVTARYTRQFGARVMKSRPPSRPGSDWWDDAMKPLTRPYRFHRDDVEDAEFQANQSAEGMPNSVAAFKNHPLYALERHLRREETIHPRTQVGTFRGEAVFHRKFVLALKTAENWMRQGRKVKEGEHPLKSVKQRAVTLEKRRAQEMAQMDGEEVTQGLYARWQTEVFRPDPVVDGRVPKNAFGNIDLYVPSMLPYGGVHLPYKGIARVAKGLGFDYAEAVVGFEFRKRRAVPILEGIVVAVEHEETLLEAYWETAHIAEEQERSKVRDRALKRWIRLIQGLRIRQRLQTQYSTDRTNAAPGSGVTDNDDDDRREAGGFLTSVADVIQPYHLPKAVSYVRSAPPAPMNDLQDNSDHWQRDNSYLADSIALSPTPHSDNLSLNDGKALQQSPISRRTPHLKTVAQLAAEEMHPPLGFMDLQKQEDSPDSRPLEKALQKADRNEATAAPERAGKRRRSAVGPTSPSETSTAKRSRRQPAQKNNVPSPSTRALRPRKQKAADIIRAEKELEEAIRRAAEESEGEV
ncbi:Rad4-domain-containing protein [Calocera viscosa TUFC12733]|uniref:Rad4-domain-containing protein n=1 Tax=Calocera viscosa (strain TUFC12733) TaxID=1330018 RepID=A0A167MSB8_CALVF|nr:Rad4-domain-containing protein [Calocera viscosa TUFC12733]